MTYLGQSLINLSSYSRLPADNRENVQTRKLGELFEAGQFTESVKLRAGKNVENCL